MIPKCFHPGNLLGRPTLSLRGVKSRVSAGKQSHRWDRPAQNAGLPVIRHPGPRSGGRKWRAGTPAALSGTGGRCASGGTASGMSVEDARDITTAGCPSTGDCFAALAMITATPETDGHPTMDSRAGSVTISGFGFWIPSCPGMTGVRRATPQA